MTLERVISLLEAFASQQPSVNSIVRNDVFRLNALPDARYGVVSWMQGQHSTSLSSSLVSYRFSLLYIDRLKADRSNEVEIQSVGITTLDNIVRMMAGSGVHVDRYSFQAFDQRFLDECAGVLCNVNFIVPKSDCSE